MRSFLLHDTLGKQVYVVQQERAKSVENSQRNRVPRLAKFSPGQEYSRKLGLRFLLNFPHQHILRVVYAVKAKVNDGVITGHVKSGYL